MSRIGQVLASPGHALSVGMALARGHWTRLWCRVRGVRFTAGKGLRVFGKLSIRGPGQVIFGDNVGVWETVTPWTYDRDAVITVGDNVMLGGTKFGCKKEITIGKDTIIATASLTDTDFHSIKADRRQPGAAVRVAPIVIAENVWIGQFAGILPGTRIGQNSVVSFGAICMREYPANVVIVGNPAKVAMPLPGSGDPAPVPAPTARPSEPLSATP
ncbi:MAG: acyltransferase [Gemmatimonadales bacterium]